MIAGVNRRWVPPQEGACALWLDSRRWSSLYQTSALATLATANGDPVGGHIDQMGLRNALQATAGKRPSFDPTGCGGAPGVTFDGTDDGMSTSAALLSSATVFVVVKRATVPLYSGHVKVASTEDSALHEGRILYVGSTSKLYMANASTNWYQGFTHAVSAAGSTVQITWGWGADAASTFVRFNRAAATKADTSGTYTLISTPLPMHIGSGYFTNKSIQSIGEVLVFSENLSQTKIDKIEAYLSRKWGTP